MNDTKKPPTKPLRTMLTSGLLLALMTSVSLAGPRTAQILPINSQPYGKTYGAWGAAWWQWALSIPAASNPLLDTTGEFAGVGQSGPVWFMGGSFGDSVERSFQVPAGKALFIPVHQWIFGSCAGDCNPTAPVPCDVPTLQAAAASAASGVTVMEVLIDGRALPGLGNYRAASPGGFSIQLPEDNVLELFGLPTPAGTYDPQVSDGYWLMVAPLASGEHTIRVHAENPSFGLNYVVTYHITIRGQATTSGGI